MGGEFVADDDGVLEVVVETPDAGTRTLLVEGYEPGEEVYADVTRGRFR